MEGQWGLWKESAGKPTIFLVALPNNRRDRETLEPIIEAPHKTGNDDHLGLLESLYDRLGAAGFQHLRVKHSLNFVDMTTGALATTVESLWWQIKRHLPSTATPNEKSGHRTFASIHLAALLRPSKAFRVLLDAASHLYTDLKLGAAGSAVAPLRDSTRR